MPIRENQEIFGRRRRSRLGVWALVVVVAAICAVGIYVYDQRQTGRIEALQSEVVRLRGAVGGTESARESIRRVASAQLKLTNGQLQTVRDRLQAVETRVRKIEENAASAPAEAGLTGDIAAIRKDVAALARKLTTLEQRLSQPAAAPPRAPVPSHAEEPAAPTKP